MAETTVETAKYGNVPKDTIKFGSALPLPSRSRMGLAI